jgi:hypothetical protein
MPELDPWLADHVSGDLTQMALDLSATDPRVQKGCVLASQSQRWICGRSRHGEQVFGIPSQRQVGLYHPDQQDALLVPRLPLPRSRPVQAHRRGARRRVEPHLPLSGPQF